MSCSPDASRGNQRSCCSSVPGQEERQRPELLDREDEAGRRAGMAQLLDGEADAQQLAAEAAVALGERQGEDVVVGKQSPQVVREFAGPIDLGGTRCHPLVREDTDGVAEHLVLLGQAIRSGGAGRVGHRGHPSSGSRGEASGRGRPSGDGVGYIDGVRRDRRGGRSPVAEVSQMDQTTQLLVLVAAAAIGIVATVAIMRRQRKVVEESSRENPFAREHRGHEAMPELWLRQPRHRRHVRELREAPALTGLVFRVRRRWPAPATRRAAADGRQAASPISSAAASRANSAGS